MLLKSDSLSDIGRHRKRNEDACYHNAQAGLFLIADGMGGHPAGDVASHLAIESLRVQLERPNGCDDPEEIPLCLESAFRQANLTVRDAGQRNPKWTRMGTTASAAVIAEDRAFIANVGDSRIYLLHAGNLRQYSKDHNPTDARLFAGRRQNLANILTQAIGLEPAIEIYQQQFTVASGDRLLLCTDGLNNMLPDTEIQHLLNHAETPTDAGRQLVAAANSSGGYDNITVIVIDITG